MAVIGNAPFQGLVSGGNIIDASIEGVDLSTSAIAARLGYTPVDPGAATFTANPTISSGNTYGVPYLSGSKVVTTGSAFTFNGTNVGIGLGGVATNARLEVAATTGEIFRADGTGGGFRIIANQTDILLQGVTSIQNWINGTIGMRLTSTGLGIGLGATDPYAKLTVKPNSGWLNVTSGRLDATNNVRLEAAGTASTYIEYRGYLGHIWDVDTAEQMRLTSGGLTVSPSSGAGYLSLGSNAGRAQYQYINFGGNAGGTDYGWQIGRSASNGIVPDGFYIYDIKANTTRLTINPSGQVGVGTIYPQSPLHIYTPTIATDAKVTALRLGSLYSGGNARNAITFWGSTDTDRMSEIVNGWQAAGSYLAVYTRNLNTQGGGLDNSETAITEKLRVTAQGNLLLGTTTSAAGFSTLVLSGGPSSNNSGIQIGYGSGSFGGGAITTANAAGGGLTIWTYTGAVGGETYTRSLDVRNNGYIGIGESNPQTLLHLSGTSQDIYLDNFGVTQNGLKLRYQTNSSHGFNFTYRPNDATCYIDSTYQASSGTVYGDIIFSHNIGGIQTPRMTLKAYNGSMLLGTTSETGGGGWLQIGQVPNSTSSSIGFNNNDNAVISSKYSQVYQIDNTASVSGRSFSWKTGGKGYGDGTLLLDLTSTSLVTSVPIELANQRLRDTSGTGRVFYNVTNVNDLYSGGSTVGAIVIDTTIPAHTAGTMLMIKISGYSYNSSQPWEMNIGVYSGENNFYSRGYECLSNPFDIVRLAKKTTGSANTMSIILGNGSGTYGTSVYVEKVIMNFSNQNVSWATGWSMSRSTTLSGYTDVVTVNGSVNGIPFKPTIPTSGTGAYSTDPNTLDDYEEGTWDPTPGGLTSISYGYRQGTYVKVGRIVTVFWDFTINSSSGSGSSFLYGLPFTVANDQAGYSVALHRDSSLIVAGAANTQLKGYADKGTTYIALQLEYSGSSGYYTQGTATYNNSGRHTGYCTYTAAN